MSDDKVSLVLHSGTDDKLEAAAVLAVGAAAVGREVDLFLQYWALDAFRADRIRKDHGVSAEAGPEGAEAIGRMREREGHQHWADLLVQAKDIGTLTIQACALSMDLLGLTEDDLDPIVDGVEGVASFMTRATGQILFV